MGADDRSRSGENDHSAVAIRRRAGSIAPMWMRLVLCLNLLAQPAVSAEVTVAVASNFLTTARDLAILYEADSEDRILLVHGSTGRIAAQIPQGAPFDVFLSADSVRPEQLVAAGQAVAAAPYAIGRLVFATRASAGVWPDVLDPARPVALANPELAPYGAAAQSALRTAGRDVNELDVILGDSVAQVASFLVTGNVRQGFVAAAQSPFLPETLRVVPVPVAEDALEQSAALLTDTPEARAFFNWLRTDMARDLIAAAGYDLPEVGHP